MPIIILDCGDNNPKPFKSGDVGLHGFELMSFLPVAKVDNAVVIALAVTERGGCTDVGVVVPLVREIRRIGVPVVLLLSEGTRCGVVKKMRSQNNFVEQVIYENK